MTYWVTCDGDDIYIGSYKNPMQRSMKISGIGSSLDVFDVIEDFWPQLLAEGKHVLELRFKTPPKQKEIVICKNLLVNLCWQTLDGYSFIVKDGARCTIRNGTLTGLDEEGLKVLRVDDGMILLKNLDIKAYSIGGDIKGVRTRKQALIMMQPDPDIILGKSINEIRKMRQHCVIMPNTKILCLSPAGSVIYSQQLSSDNVYYKEISAYLKRPRLDIKGEIYGYGSSFLSAVNPGDLQVPIYQDTILLHEFGNDKNPSQGSNTYIHDTAILSCQIGVPICHINSGRLTLYGGFIKGSTGIVTRYRNSIVVPEDSSVSVVGTSNLSANYNTTISAVDRNDTTGQTFIAGQTSYNNSNHAWALGHALQVDQQDITFNYNDNVISVMGGTWTSEHNYAIASYPYSNKTNMLSARMTKFVGPNAVLNSGKASTGAEYNFTTTDGADYDIMKPEHPEPVIIPQPPTITSAYTVGNDDTFVNLNGGVLKVTGENLEDVTKVEFLRGNNTHLQDVPVTYSNGTLTSVEPLNFASADMPTYGNIRVTTEGGKARKKVFFIDEAE